MLVVEDEADLLVDLQFIFLVVIEPAVGEGVEKEAHGLLEKQVLAREPGSEL